MFKLLNGLTGVQRQLVQLSLTLSSLIFMAAGIVHMMENDLKQHLEVMMPLLLHHSFPSVATTAYRHNHLANATSSLAFLWPYTQILNFFLSLLYLSFSLFIYITSSDQL